MEPSALNGTRSGWRRPSAPVAREISSTGPPAGGVHGSEKRTHAERRFGSCRRARCQVAPPSVLTSTRLTGPVADHARPWSTWSTRGSVASHGNSNALLTTCSENERGYHFVFHGDHSRAVETSIRPTHLTLAIPIQPGTTSRTG